MARRDGVRRSRDALNAEANPRVAVNERSFMVGVGFSYLFVCDGGCSWVSPAAGEPHVVAFCTLIPKRD